MNPRRKSTLEIQRVGNEVLVHDPDNGKVHVLNATAGQVIELCDGTHSIADISRGFAASADVDYDVIESDVRALVAKFAELELVMVG